MRFQSKKHKRMNGKQSCVSFLASDLSFMASRVPVTVTRALAVTTRDVFSRVPTLHCQQPSQSVLKMSKRSLCHGAHGQKELFALLPFGRWKQSFRFFVVFCFSFSIYRQSGNPGMNSAVSMTTLCKADIQLFHNNVF